MSIVAPVFDIDSYFWRKVSRRVLRHYLVSDSAIAHIRPCSGSHPHSSTPLEPFFHSVSLSRLYQHERKSSHIVDGPQWNSMSCRTQLSIPHSVHPPLLTILDSTVSCPSFVTFIGESCDLEVPAFSLSNSLRNNRLCATTSGLLSEHATDPIRRRPQYHPYSAALCNHGRSHTDIAITYRRTNSRDSISRTAISQLPLRCHSGQLPVSQQHLDKQILQLHLSTLSSSITDLPKV